MLVVMIVMCEQEAELKIENYIVILAFPAALPIAKGFCRRVWILL